MIANAHAPDLISTAHPPAIALDISPPMESSKTRANRANALFSTGPRTPEAKAATSQNALKHGLSSAKPPSDPAFQALWNLQSRLTGRLLSLTKKLSNLASYADACRINPLPPVPTAPSSPPAQNKPTPIPATHQEPLTTNPATNPILQIKPTRIQATANILQIKPTISDVFIAGATKNPRRLKSTPE